MRAGTRFRPVAINVRVRDLVGFRVPDLDGAHARAVAAGAREHFPPLEEGGLPRHSCFEDPSGNRVVLGEA